MERPSLTMHRSGLRLLGRLLTILLLISATVPTVPAAAFSDLAAAPTSTPTATRTPNKATILPPTSSCPRWDVNCDGIADILDLTDIGKAWGQTGSPGWVPEDVNSDGLVDINDVVV